jgi:hypothetical protein
MQLQLPNPAQLSDFMNTLELLLSGAQVPGPGGVVVSSPNTGSTTQTYMVVAKGSGWQAPGPLISTTTGPATLSVSAFNTISWNFATAGLTVTSFDVYRVTGGAAQGRIAINLPATQLSLVDNGLVADSTYTTVFNTSAYLAPGGQGAVQVLTGTLDQITLAEGTVIINNAAALDACTISAPIAGSAASGGMDGCFLTLYSLSAKVNTVTGPLHCFNSAGALKNIITFTAGTAGLFIQLVAYNGVWYIVANITATLSGS